MDCHRPDYPLGEGRYKRVKPVALLLGIFAASSGMTAEFEIDRTELQEIPPAPGTVIDSTNIDRFGILLDPDLAAIVQRNFVEITVGETTSFRPHQAYIQATQRYGGQTRLGEPGTLENYSGGRPFPGPPSLDDARAGEKITWNMRLTYNGDTGHITEMHWQLRKLGSDKIEREMEFSSKSMRFMYRHVVPPVPFVKKNPANAFGAFYLRAVDAAEMTGVEIVAFASSEDTKGSDGWVYVPRLERTQSLKAYSKRETMFGSDILSDDLFGYSGRLVDMAWTFIGDTRVLLPMYRHDQVTVTEGKAHRSDYHFVYFHGKGGCFPNITWQLRHAYIVAGTRTIEDYPVSKRIMYIDAQTYHAALVKLYDERGEFWKLSIIGLAHPNSHDAHNHATGAPIIDSAAMIDLINKRCTTVQLRSLINVDDLTTGDFEPSRLGGRRGRAR
jgi:hypothetical protein